MAILKLNQKSANKAIKEIESGGVVIFPTDTVYGFLADAGNKKAVGRVYKMKKRAKSKPLPLFVSDIKKAGELAEISSEQRKILEKYWPGRYTFVLRRKPGIKIFRADKKTVAVRVPDYKPLNYLLKKIGRPLVQTSANISNQPALVKIKDIIEEFENTEVLIVDAGNLPKRNPSSIMDLTKSDIKILRK